MATDDEIAIIAMTRELTSFALWVQSLDAALTHAEASIIAASIIGGLPELFAENEQLKLALGDAIAEMKNRKKRGFS